MCIKHNTKECDNCGNCHEDIRCYICENKIAEDEDTYQVGSHIYCEECLKNKFRI